MRRLILGLMGGLVGLAGGGGVRLEAPDPRLSSIEVLSTGGQQFQQGPTQEVPGDPLQLRVALKPLPTGVYTVSGLTFSHVDGHVAGGAFAFGVRMDPAKAVIPASLSGPPGP